MRVVLLAESHVFTSDADREYKTKPIEGLGSYPEQYAKFVYCLAYGEDSLTEGVGHPAVDGTPQFWKIFFSCLNEVESNAAFAPVLKSETRTKQRIKNKIQLLKSMRDSGIWLVDVSIIALYDRGRKPATKLMAKALKASWHGYTKNILQNALPEHVIVIGKGVGKIVEPELIELVGNNYIVLPQPNAHLSAEYHLENYRSYYGLCVGQNN